MKKTYEYAYLTYDNSYTFRQNGSGISEERVADILNEQENQINKLKEEIEFLRKTLKQETSGLLTAHKHIKVLSEIAKGNKVFISDSINAFSYAGKL